MSWSQLYDPLGNRVLSTAVSALPVLTLLAVFVHSVALACLVGLIVLAYAYLFPSLIP